MTDCNCSLIRNNGDCTGLGVMNSGNSKSIRVNNSINSEYRTKTNTNGKAIDRRIDAKLKSRMRRQSVKNWDMILWGIVVKNWMG